MPGPGVETFPGSSLAPDTGISTGGRGAGIAGPSPRGRAFVPISIKDLDSFLLSFGTIRGKSFGQIAARNWLNFSEGCTYIRLLGIGDGKRRLTLDTPRADGENFPAGAVNNSGFIVGSRMTSSVNGLLGSNEFAYDGGLPGRTYFLGAFMSESAGSTYFTDAGVQHKDNYASAIWTPIDTDPASYINGLIKITDYRGTEITYLLCSGDNGGTLTGTPATGDDSGGFGVPAGKVCVQLGGLVKPTSNYVGFLQQAIDSANGNNAGVANQYIRLDKFIPSTGQSHLRLTHKGSSIYQNRDITRDVITSDSVYTISGFDGGVPTYAEASLTPVSTSGTDYEAGQFTVTDYRGTSKTYLFCAGDNSGTLTSTPTSGDDASSHGGTAGLVCVQVTTGAITVANVVNQLVIAINSANGNNAGIANQYVTLFDDVSTLVLIQNNFGLVGNRTIGRSVITSDSVYVISSFDGGKGGAVPIIRGIIFAASGVIPALSGCYTGNASTASAGATVGSFAPGQEGGGPFGTVNMYADAYKFNLLLNGHKSTDEFPNVITASFSRTRAATPTELSEEPEGGNIRLNSLYFADRLNTDPKKIQQAGHYLYSFYDVYSAAAKITADGVISPGKEKTIRPDGETTLLQEAAFIITGSLARNAADAVGNLGKPNFENFCDRFQTAKSPWIMSQTVDSRRTKLFRFHALNDGNIGNHEIKITIKDLKKASTKDGYGTFTVVVRRFQDLDHSAHTSILGTEEFTGLNLDPESDDYIVTRIGDKHLYWDFDKPTDRQRFVNDGTHDNKSYYVRVEAFEEVDKKITLPRLIPVGFSGPPHLVTSGSAIMSNPSHPLHAPAGFTGVGSIIDGTMNLWAHNLVQPPIPYRTQISDNSTYGDTSGELFLDGEFTWGIKSTGITSLKAPNETETVNQSLHSYVKYFPSFSTVRKPFSVFDNSGVPDSSGTVYDCDRFHNNEFSLENILVHTSSDVDVVDRTQWMYAKYRRDGIKTPLVHSSDLLKRTGVRFIDIAKDLSTNTNLNEYFRFTFPLFGGFDGTNIFSKESEMFTNLSAYFEMNDPAKNEKNDSTTAAYLKALDLLAEKSNSDVRLLALPGIRVESITNKALSIAEERFDAFYLMDPELFDSLGNPVTGSDQVPDLAQSAEKFRSRILGSSFGAAYFPNVMTNTSSELASLDATLSFGTESEDPATLTTIESPPSIHVIGMFSSLDRDGNFSAASGVSRGLLDEYTNALEPSLVFDDTLDSSTEKLFSNGLNPIITVTGEGTVVYGQRTLLTDVDSIMQRINVRRMLIEVRHLVREVAETMIFEPNNEGVLDAFAAECEPILRKFLNAGAIERFKIQIDTTTTTQADIEANIVRGKIFLQPTKSDEIIEVDFST